MGTWRDEYIEEESKAIREKLAKGILMGILLNMNNPDEIILCAYLMGKQEAQHAASRDMQLLEELHNRAKG